MPQYEQDLQFSRVFLRAIVRDDKPVLREVLAHVRERNGIIGHVHSNGQITDNTKFFAEAAKDSSNLPLDGEYGWNNDKVYFMVK